jgi:hypothetical protein
VPALEKVTVKGAEPTVGSALTLTIGVLLVGA